RRRQGAQDRVDADRIEDVELTPGEIADHRTAQSLRVGPGPAGALLLVAVGQWYLVDHEVRTAAIGERQHRDPERCVALIVGCDLDIQAAGIEFDYPVEQGLASVASQLVLGLKERPPLLRAVAD